MALLDITDLSIAFRGEDGEVPVVEHVDLSIDEGQVVGLVGESGCGKSVTARAVMRILPTPPARIAGGTVGFEGTDLLRLGERAMRRVRGNGIGMIFQEPMTSLNPTYTVGFQIAEALTLHRRMTGAEVEKRVLELLDLVGIGAPRRRMKQYPFELSGGLRQRIMIAIALACDPKLLIADEPTTALDVTVQAQILDLLRQLRDRLGMAILMITHDLGVVAEFCDRVAVMYAGRIVEEAPVEALFQAPLHPYTRGLLASMPRLDRSAGRLPAIPGMVPPPGRRPPGCAFAERCDRALARCRETVPRLAGEEGHAVACWNPGR